MLQFTLAITLLLQSSAIGITSPASGDTLRGLVEIIGSLDVPEFSSAELGFGYASNPSGSWFIIRSFSQSTSDSILAVWDTSTVTDGDYNLRLRVFFRNGSYQDVLVDGLKIRNDQPEPTPTPRDDIQPVSNATPTMGVIPTLTPAYEFSTPLPPNPAGLTVPLIIRSLGRGALIAAGLFLMAWFVFRWRKD